MGSGMCECAGGSAPGWAGTGGATESMGGMRDMHYMQQPNSARHPHGGVGALPYATQQLSWGGREAPPVSTGMVSASSRASCFGASYGCGQDMAPAQPCAGGGLYASDAPSVSAVRGAAPASVPSSGGAGGGGGGGASLVAAGERAAADMLWKQSTLGGSHRTNSFSTHVPAESLESVYAALLAYVLP